MVTTSFAFFTTNSFENDDGPFCCSPRRWIIQWLQKQQAILDPAEWGSDLELRLLAIGLKGDIMVITEVHDGSTYVRHFPSKPLPIPKMRGGNFISSNKLCSQWASLNPTPLLVVYNGHSHYDSNLCSIATSK